MLGTGFFKKRSKRNILTKKEKEELEKDYMDENDPWWHMLPEGALNVFALSKMDVIDEAASLNPEKYRDWNPKQGIMNDVLQTALTPFLMGSSRTMLHNEGLAWGRFLQLGTWGVGAGALLMASGMMPAAVLSAPFLGGAFSALSAAAGGSLMQVGIGAMAATFFVNRSVSVKQTQEYQQKRLAKETEELVLKGYAADEKLKTHLARQGIQNDLNKEISQLGSLVDNVKNLGTDSGPSPHSGIQAAGSTEKLTLSSEKRAELLQKVEEMGQRLNEIAAKLEENGALVKMKNAPEVRAFKSLASSGETLKELLQNNYENTELVEQYKKLLEENFQSAQSSSNDFDTRDAEAAFEDRIKFARDSLKKLKELKEEMNPSAPLEALRGAFQREAGYLQQSSDPDDIKYLKIKNVPQAMSLSDLKSGGDKTAETPVASGGGEAPSPV